MPALKAFGRRWNLIGSDDFVLLGISDFVIRMPLLIATVIVYSQNYEQLDSDCVNEEEVLFQIKYFFYGTFGTILLIILADIALICNSMVGLVMETEKRRFVPLCIYIRTGLFLVDLIWNVLGTYWFSLGILKCSQAPSAEKLVQGLIICNWLLIAFTFIFIVIIYNTLGTYEFTLNKNNDVDELIADPKLTRLWSIRFRFLFFYFWTNNEDINQSFREFASYIAASFDTDEIVFSDFLCGLILLYLRTRESRLNKLDSVSVSPSKSFNNATSTDFVKTHTSDSKIDISPSQFPSDLPPSEEWNSLPKLHHFYKYAMACYSWGVVCCTYPNPLRSLWKSTFCFGCLRQNPTPPFEKVEGDNCCFLNSGTTGDILLKSDESVELLYCSFQNKVYLTPFIVALDHGEKAVVIAFRGSVTNVDIVTDMYVRPVSIAQFGYPEEFRVHKGMLLNTLSVYKKLQELQLVSKLLKTHPDYKIICTGTSLGSGSATILALILRKEWPQTEVKVYAYAPSATVMNLEAAKYCESFVTTVIYGDDVFGRMTIKNSERLKFEIIKVLKECPEPKYKIYIKGILTLLCGGRSSGVTFSQDKVIHPEKNSNTSKPVKKLSFELTYPAGKILHITENSDFQKSKRKPGGGDFGAPPPPRWNIRWAGRNEFQDIIVSTRMLMDHFPFRQNKALQDLARRWQQSQLQLEQNSNKVKNGQQDNCNGGAVNFSGGSFGVNDNDKCFMSEAQFLTRL